jgi:hypothetical protein
MAEKILIVDDDIDSLKLIGLMLQRQGYEISAASAGGQAIAARAVPATDDDSVRRCSEATHRKYAGVPGERSMLAAKALPTTLRLEPI